LLAQAARVPPRPPLIKSTSAPKIIILGLLDGELRLPRQARHVRDAQFWRFNAVTISTGASTHEAFSGARMYGLETDVAFLPLRVVRARLDRDHDGLFIFFVGVVLLGAAALLDLFT